MTKVKTAFDNDTVNTQVVTGIDYMLAGSVFPLVLIFALLLLGRNTAKKQVMQ